MKKTVLALAAIAASSAAFAQSSVTLYGVVDASVESVKGTNSANNKSTTFNRVSSGNLATSRFGLKGVEDLGGGLKAKFQLESAINVDTGANGGGTSRFFDRAAWVGVSSADAGELRIGRQDSLIGAQIADTIGAQAYDASVVAGTLGGTGSLFRRLDNAVTYIAPTFVPGLTASAQYTTAADATANNGATPAVLNSAENLSGSNKGRGFGLSANYVMGPAAAGVSYIRIKGAPASAVTVTTGAQANAGLYVYGAYDLGVAKLTAFYNDDTPSANTATDGHRLYGFQAAVPVITNLTVTGGYAYAHNVTTAGVYDAKGTKHDNAGIITLKAQYDLSKRTAVYALFTEIQNGDKAALGLSGVSTIADKSARGLAVGVRHAF